MKQEILKKFRVLFESNMKDTDQNMWPYLEFLSNNLDLYAMEFLKECLPEKVEEKLYAGQEWCITGQEHNNCIDKILENANNKLNGYKEN